MKTTNRRIIEIVMSMLTAVTMIPVPSFGTGLPFTDVPRDAWY